MIVDTKSVIIINKTTAPHDKNGCATGSPNPGGLGGLLHEVFLKDDVRDPALGANCVFPGVVHL